MRELRPDDLLLRTNPERFAFRTTHEHPEPAVEGLIGQERAEASLRFGLGVREVGFNITVAGPRGTGKTTAVQALLAKVVEGSPIPSDWCYVHNFRDAFHPRALKLPAGTGRKLVEDIDAAIKRLVQEVPRAFEGEEYTTRREGIGRRLEKLREDTFNQLSVHAQSQGFLLQGSPVGFFLIPVVAGKPMSDDELAAQAPEARAEILKRRDALMDEVRDAMKGLRVQERAAQEQADALERELATQVVSHVTDDVVERYADYADVVEHFKQIEEDLISNVGLLRSAPPQPAGLPQQPWPPPALLRRYQINLAVDNSHLRAAPVVFERNPTPANLLGRIEREAQFGALITDFTMIRTGTLHQANGGYLVIEMDDLVRYPLSWDGLKRAIRDREATVEEIGERIGIFEAKSLRPQPIPWDAKVIIVGTHELIGLLRLLDPDMEEFFKVKADFDSSVPRTIDSEAHYANILAALCKRFSGCPLDRGAVAAIIEYASRLADDRQMLSTRFGEIADVVTEASHWAAGQPAVTAEHVRHALEQRTYRSSLARDKLLQFTKEGTIVINAVGTAVGVVNGLTVLGDGDFRFGRPVRITATVGLGREGLIDIEREVQLAGPIYSKASMIVAGFLADRYSRDKLLAITARLVFEQTYGGVEGDSASCAEIFALLSRLAGLPVKQGIAVTGSVDQFGSAQAIGGVNEKIEGFFDYCAAVGFTGDQGVLIPDANARNLMLRDDVVQAVAAGKFHVWTMKDVDEGIELLTGVPAGTYTNEGWTPGSVNALVDEQLMAMATALQAAEQAEADG